MTGVTKNQIVSGLKGLLNAGDRIMVHSSLSSFGYVSGGADTVIDALLEVVGDEGTMMVPTNVFNGYLTTFLRETKETDLRIAPSRMGAITETLRMRDGALRSIHPSHPVAALGRDAKELLKEHGLGDSPIGKLSPYGKLAQLENGKILLLGVTNSNNSTIHLAEELYTPYIFIGEAFDTKVTDLVGNIHRVLVKGYCIDTPRNYPVIDGELLKRGIMERRTIGKSVVSMIKAGQMMEFLREKILENPYYLLKDN